MADYWGGMMPRVTGEFEVTLRTPISISFDFDANKVAALRFEVDKNNILVCPLEPRPPVTDEGGELIEPPALERIRIWITKNVQELIGTPPKRLPTKERERFEPIIIEATRRLVRAVVKRTREWDLDYRQPVSCYASKYFLHDEKLDVESLQESTRLIPEESAEGQIIWHVDEFQGELTKDIWQEVATEIQEPVKLNHYDEAIFDAMTFRKQLQYGTAILYAAFAAETILKEISIALLDKKGLAA